MNLKITGLKTCPLVCRIVLARLRIEMTVLQYESDQFCIEFMVDI